MGGSTNSNRLTTLMAYNSFTLRVPKDDSGKFLHHQQIRNNRCCSATYDHFIKCNPIISLTA